MPMIESRVRAVAAAKGFPTVRALSRASGLSRTTVRGFWQQTPRYMLASTLATLCATLDAQPGQLLIYLPDDAATD